MYANNTPVSGKPKEALLSIRTMLLCENLSGRDLLKTVFLDLMRRGRK